MGKYENLGRYLGSLSDSTTRVRLKFSDIENILGFDLPNSARIYRAWWANDGTHVQARDGWLGAGWVVEYVDLEKEVVTFARTSSLPNSFFEYHRDIKDRKKSFEKFAREVMSRHFGVELYPRKKADWPKLFDMVSDDYQIVGDAKALTMVRGEKIPPAKFSIIAEHVWMLEKINAKIKFLVFGKDIRVPKEWLKRYGRFVNLVQFYFLSDDGNLLKLN